MPLSHKRNAEVCDFWMRRGGSETKVFRHQRSANQPISANFFSALVRRDKSAADSILSLDSSAWVLEFLGLIQDNAFAGFSFTAMAQMGLLNTVKNFEIDCDSKLGQATFGSWFSCNFFENIMRMSIIEEEYHGAFCEKLKTVARHLEGENVSVLWTKGNGLARILYDEPHHRQSTDFDITVRPGDAEQLHVSLSRIGYSPILGDPGFCHQLEVGPCSSFDQLFAVPCSELVPSAVIGYRRPGWPLIDVKFNPLDRGLTCIETPRFFDQSIEVGRTADFLRVPSHIDHLMISIVHAEKDRFESWKSLVDMHLLCKTITDLDGWTEFERRVNCEGIRHAAWAALCILEERFDSSIGAGLIDRLAPKTIPLIELLSFSADPMFSWNGSSLLMLLINAVYTGDMARKLKVLRKCFHPNAEFLKKYYGSFPAAPVMHFFVLLLPAVVIRKTFGRKRWPSADQYSNIENEQAI